MNMTQLPFLVEGLIILAAMVLGGLLGRKATPYGQVKLGFHLFFFAWFSLGYYYVAQGVFSAGTSLPVSLLTALMGVALALQIGTGIVFLARRSVWAGLPKVHGISAAVLLLADVGGLVAAGLS